MITLKSIAEGLEQLLNGVDFENLERFGLNNVTEDTLYVFNVCLDEGMYKAPERIGNKVIRYINAQMSIVGNKVEGTAEEAYHAIIDTSVDFLIPLNSEGKDGTPLLSCVRNLLTTTLQVSSQTNEYEGNILYLHTINYSIANTGYRDQIERVGDCITLTLDISHQFVVNGVSSDAFEIYVLDKDNEYKRVRYQRAGFSRKTVSEANVPSNPEGKLSAFSMPSSSSFALTMDLITRLDAIDDIVREYILGGDLKPITIRIVAIKKEFNVENQPIYSKYSKEYMMILDTGGINLELNLPSSTSISLIEGKVL